MICSDGEPMPKKKWGQVVVKKKNKKKKKNTGSNLAYYVVYRDRGAKGALWGAFLCPMVSLIHFF